MVAVRAAAIRPGPGGINVPGYVATKSGIAGLSRALANEWAGRGVNVNAIVPGYAETADAPYRGTLPYPAGSSQKGCATHM